MNQKSYEWKTEADFIPYPAALHWMDLRVKAIQQGKAPECVWLLEHPPLYTKGTSGKDTDILTSAKHPVFETGRGGQVTYHGPGQCIAYVMVDLKPRYLDIRKYVYELEEWIIQTLKRFNINGERRQGRIGIWVDKNGADHKIAAIGVRVQKWVTSHGIAINVNPDLSAYDNIIPCGLKQYGVTSLADLGMNVSLEAVDDVLRETFPF
jgi:lipoyl(octanoyl) transferase